MWRARLAVVSPVVTPVFGTAANVAVSTFIAFLIHAHSDTCRRWTVFDRTDRET